MGTCFVNYDCTGGVNVAVDICSGSSFPGIFLKLSVTLSWGISCYSGHWPEKLANVQNKNR